MSLGLASVAARSNDAAGGPGRKELTTRYVSVRAFTEQLCQGLAPEDTVVQSMADVSPTKWHLAHTSWFFETFILQRYAASYQPLDPHYAFLFNSYYVNAGERHCRAQRGYISRPTLAEVYAYRRHVDVELRALLDAADADTLNRIRSDLILGINHEQQHQELILTDIKHVFSVNPLRPALRPPIQSPAVDVQPMRWIDFAKDVHAIGWEGGDFAYDNEGPRHEQIVQGFSMASRPVTNGEYLEFMADGGYTRQELWLSDGVAAIQTNDWTEPFYWERRDDEWWTYTLHGMKPVDPTEPICHISYFEADAFARWAGARLPTEAEWEVAARSVAVAGNFAESDACHPQAAQGGEGLLQMFGDVWEWTRSQYSPYPGYQPIAGALGEYNGKFMCNQFVLRGGSCATSRTHIRPTYRNFFPPEATWQFSGFRMARDA